jgi:hypothetical protein
MAQTAPDGVVSGAEVGHRVANDRVSRTGASRTLSTPVIGVVPDVVTGCVLERRFPDVSGDAEPDAYREPPRRSRSALRRQCSAGVGVLSVRTGRVAHIIEQPPVPAPAAAADRQRLDQHHIGESSARTHSPGRHASPNVPSTVTQSLALLSLSRVDCEVGRARGQIGVARLRQRVSRKARDRTAERVGGGQPSRCMASVARRSTSA